MKIYWAMRTAFRLAQFPVEKYGEPIFFSPFHFYGKFKFTDIALVHKMITFAWTQISIYGKAITTIGRSPIKKRRTEDKFVCCRSRSEEKKSRANDADFFTSFFFSPHTRNIYPPLSLPLPLDKSKKKKKKCRSIYRNRFCTSFDTMN